MLRFIILTWFVINISYADELDFKEHPEYLTGKYASYTTNADIEYFGLKETKPYFKVVSGISLPSCKGEIIAEGALENGVLTAKDVYDPSKMACKLFITWLSKDKIKVEEEGCERNREENCGWFGQVLERKL